MISAFIVSFLLAAIKIVLTCMPSDVVDWILRKFALHPTLNSKDVKVTYNGKHLKSEEKMKFTDYFNEAIFLKKYFVFQGNEQLFLHPETNVSPIVVDMKKGKKAITLFVFCYTDHVDVVKQFKNRVVAYQVRSDQLQTLSPGIGLLNKAVF
ncbi:YfmQ family protein [Metabacillus schmidteae]|uniref:YfmQ family protein n=1 Tax=Metabacillus schmidteae TaxID=2730405 RepID=UPI00158EF4D2|nr:YfmQ family protein [Metabacillus schmidteae]